MNFDFSLILFGICLVAVIVWLVDLFLLRKKRESRLQLYLQSSNINPHEFAEFWSGLVNGNELSEAEVAKAKSRGYLQACQIKRDPLPVEYAKSFFPVLFGVLVLRSFLFEPFQIPTGSMIPTLNVGDYIVVNKYAYGVRIPVLGTKLFDIDQPKRGDIMVFIPPHEPVYYIKRVIGLPGDKIEYRNKTVYVNGEALIQHDSEYLPYEGVNKIREDVNGITNTIYTSPSRFEPNYPFMPIEGYLVPEGHYFMMGDNRDNSYDSRGWGPVPEENIVGKAVAVWMQKQAGLNMPSFSENRFILNPE
jgi:signal peptidase I